MRGSLGIAATAGLAVALLGGCSLLRATSGRMDDATAGPNTCVVGIPEDETVAERVAALRAIGLFADRAELTDEALATSVQAGLDEWWGDLDGAGWFQELAVAEQDRSRVWWQDLEADVSDGNEVYRQ